MAFEELDSLAIEVFPCADLWAFGVKEDGQVFGGMSCVSFVDQVDELCVGFVSAMGKVQTGGIHALVHQF